MTREFHTARTLCHQSIPSVSPVRPINPLRPTKSDSRMTSRVRVGVPCRQFSSMGFSQDVTIIKTKYYNSGKEEIRNRFDGSL